MPNSLSNFLTKQLIAFEISSLFWVIVKLGHSFLGVTVNESGIVAGMARFNLKKLKRSASFDFNGLGH